MSWLRPDSVWAGRLEAMGLPWDDMPFGAVAVVFSDLTKVGYNGSSTVRPDLTDSSAARLGPLSRHLGFATPTGIY